MLQSGTQLAVRLVGHKRNPLVFPEGGHQLPQRLVHGRLPALTPVIVLHRMRLTVKLLMYSPDVP